MELDDVEPWCFKLAPKASKSFPLKSDRFILEAIFERRCNVPRKTYLEEIQLSNLFVVRLNLFLPVEKASDGQRPLLTVCSINSAIASYKSHHSWPRQVSVLLLDWGQTI
jgi:hypothetical protein